MDSSHTLSRRTFLASTAMTPLVLAAKGAAAAGHIPIGLELFSVRDDLAKDLPGTVRAVAAMGYECVEFFSPYEKWTDAQAKDVRKLLDDLGIHCYSTHNGSESFRGDGLERAIALNQLLGTHFIVMAHPGRVEGLDGYRKVAELLTSANETMGAHGLHAGYHNHQDEWKPIDGKRPLEVIAAGTPHDVMMQLDVGTCVEMGGDPVAWINANPGRIRSLHLKDYSPDAGKGYKVLFGDGAAPWKQIFEAAEKTGGVEYYLIEQEGSALPEIETAKRCLANYRGIHSA